MNGVECIQEIARMAQESGRLGDWETMIIALPSVCYDKNYIYANCCRADEIIAYVT